MRILVVGAGGFVGGYLRSHFDRAGNEVVPVGRHTPLPADPVDVVVDCNGDARRFWANENPALSYCATVESTLSRLAALRAGRYVYLSSVDVYGAARGDRRATREDQPILLDGLETYGLHKHQAEQAVRDRATGPLVLRVGTLIGPGLRKNPVFDALHGDPIRQTPDSTLTLITLSKLAQAIDRLLAADAVGTFNVTASASMTVAAMLGQVARALGCPPGAFAFHDELLATAYDISVEKMSRLMALPDSAAMLAEYLAGPR